MNEWIKEWMNKWMNEWIKRREECCSRWVNEWMNEDREGECVPHTIPTNLIPRWGVS
jgi:hypothetical protein